MADNNEVILETIKYIAEKTIEGLQYDKTVTCEVISNLGNGEYSVKEGSTTYSAYSKDTYSVGDTVYVSIPNSDYNKQKFIVGKVVGDATTDYNYIDPLTDYFNITGNLINTTDEYKLIANDELKAEQTDRELTEDQINKLYDQKVSLLTSIGYTAAIEQFVQVAGFSSYAELSEKYQSYIQEGLTNDKMKEDFISRNPKATAQQIQDFVNFLTLRDNYNAQVNAFDSSLRDKIDYENLLNDYSNYLINNGIEKDTDKYKDEMAQYGQELLSQIIYPDGDKDESGTEPEATSKTIKESYEEVKLIYTSLPDWEDYDDALKNSIDYTNLINAYRNALKDQNVFNKVNVITKDDIQYNETKFIDITVPEEKRGDFTHLAIKAYFKTYLEAATKGNYGLHFYIVTENEVNNGNLTGYNLYLDTDDMIGDPYNYMTYFTQSKLFEINDNETIIRIIGYYYQRNNFYISDGELYPRSIITQQIIADPAGVNDIYNIFIKDIDISLGYADIDEEKLLLYTPSDRTYDYRVAGLDNKKKLCLRWNHIINANTNEAVAISSDSDAKKYMEDKKVIPHWYLYAVGEDDDLAGSNWREETAVIGEDGESTYVSKDEVFEFAEDSFWCRINPRAERAHEYVKAILEIIDTEGLEDYNNQYSASLENYADQMEDLQKQIENINKQIDDLENIDAGNKDHAHQSQIDNLLSKIDAIKSTQENLQFTIDNYKASTSSYYTYLECTVNVGGTWEEYLTFTNKDTSASDEETQKIDGMAITCTNDGVYNIYNTLNNKANNIPGVQTATVSLTSKYLKTTSKNGDITKMVWCFPKEYTMIDMPISGTNYYVDDNTTFSDSDSSYPGYYVITRLNPNLVETESDTYAEKYYSYSQTFQIKNTLRQTFTNNTIKCIVWRDGDDYEADLTLHFGVRCSNGTDNTLTITPVELYYNTTVDTKTVKTVVETNPIAITINSTENNGLYNKANKLSLQYNFFDANDNNINNEVTRREWKVIYNSNEFQFMSASGNNNTNILSFTAMGPTRGCIVECIITVGDKKYNAYYPIAIRNTNKVFMQSGAVQVVYNSSGSNPTYNNDQYRLYNFDSKLSYIPKTIELYYGKNTNITNKVKGQFEYPYIKNNSLSACTMYITNAKYDIWVNLKDENNNYWKQPILITRDQWESQLLNNWDGQFSVDEENGTVLGTMLGAGEKNSDNTFTGVLMGNVATAADLSDAKIGLYGLQNGIQSFGFKTDGTAFIGQSGKTQLNFDGVKGTIQNSTYSNGQGMKLSFDTDSGNSLIDGASIDMKSIGYYKNSRDIDYSIEKFNDKVTYYSNSTCSTVAKGDLNEGNVAQAINDNGGVIYYATISKATKENYPENVQYYIDEQGLIPADELHITEKDYNDTSTPYYQSVYARTLSYDATAQPYYSSSVEPSDDALAEVNLIDSNNFETYYYTNSNGETKSVSYEKYEWDSELVSTYDSSITLYNDEDCTKGNEATTENWGTYNKASTSIDNKTLGDDVYFYGGILQDLAVKYKIEGGKTSGSNTSTTVTYQDWAVKADGNPYFTDPDHVLYSDVYCNTPATSYISSYTYNYKFDDDNKKWIKDDTITYYVPAYKNNLSSYSLPLYFKFDSNSGLKHFMLDSSVSDEIVNGDVTSNLYDYDSDIIDYSTIDNYSTVADSGLIKLSDTKLPITFQTIKWYYDNYLKPDSEDPQQDIGYIYYIAKDSYKNSLSAGKTAGDIIDNTSSATPRYTNSQGHAYYKDKECTTFVTGTWSSSTTYYTYYIQKLDMTTSMSNWNLATKNAIEVDFYLDDCQLDSSGNPAIVDYYEKEDGTIVIGLYEKQTSQEALTEDEIILWQDYVKVYQDELAKATTDADKQKYTNLINKYQSELDSGLKTVEAYYDLNTGAKVKDLSLTTSLLKQNSALFFEYTGIPVRFVDNGSTLVRHNDYIEITWDIGKTRNHTSEKPTQAQRYLEGTQYYSDKDCTTRASGPLGGADSYSTSYNATYKVDAYNFTYYDWIGVYNFTSGGYYTTGTYYKRVKRKLSDAQSKSPTVKKYDSGYTFFYINDNSEEIVWQWRLTNNTSAFVENKYYKNSSKLSTEYTEGFKSYYGSVVDTKYKDYILNETEQKNCYYGNSELTESPVGLVLSELTYNFYLSTHSGSKLYATSGVLANAEDDMLIFDPTGVYFTDKDCTQRAYHIITKENIEKADGGYDLYFATAAKLTDYTEYDSTITYHTDEQVDSTNTENIVQGAINSDNFIDYNRKLYIQVGTKTVDGETYDKDNLYYKEEYLINAITPSVTDGKVYGTYYRLEKANTKININTKSPYFTIGNALSDSLIKISEDEGLIANWHLAESELYNGDTHLYSADQANNSSARGHSASNWRIRVSSKFGVDSGGNLYANDAQIDGLTATNANVSGTIYANDGTLGNLTVTGTLTGGTINGSTIKGSSISGGTVTGAVITAGDIVLKSSSLTIGSTQLYSVSGGLGIKTSGLIYLNSSSVSFPGGTNWTATDFSNLKNLLRAYTNGNIARAKSYTVKISGTTGTTSLHSHSFSDSDTITLSSI